MSAAPRISAVVVAYHRPEALDRLLAGLASGARTPADVEVVVVDIGGDPAVALVAQAHGAVHAPVRGNPGYAAGVNRGVAVSRGDVVVFMNDDLELHGATLVGLADVVARGDADVAVPCLVDAAGVREPTIAALPSVGALAREWMLLPDRPVRGLRWLRVQKWRTPTVPERVEAACAAIVAARTDVLRRHPLPESYFLYWEESDWFWELRRRGIVTQVRPELVVRHTGGRGDVRPEKTALLARNAVRCVRQTQGRTAAVLAWPVVVTWQARLVVVDALRASRRRDARSRSVLVARCAGLGAAVRAVSELRGVAR